MQSTNISIKFFPKKELNQNEELGLGIFSTEHSRVGQKSMKLCHKLVPSPVFEEGTMCTGSCTPALARHLTSVF